MITSFLDLDLDDVVEGMTLAEAVFDGFGDVLLARGAIVTEAMLVSARRRGIDRLAVLDDTVSAAELEEQRERVEERLGLLFRRCGAEDASGGLLRSIRQYRLGSDA